MDFKEVIRKYREAFGKLNTLLEEKGEQPLKMSAAKIEGLISNELRYNATLLELPWTPPGKITVLFSNKIMLMDYAGNQELKEPDEMELWSRTALPYEFSEEFIKPVSLSDLRQSEPGQNPVLD